MDHERRSVHSQEKALSQLVDRALEKAPEQRFASAAEMRQQLRAFAR